MAAVSFARRVASGVIATALACAGCDSPSAPPADMAVPQDAGQDGAVVSTDGADANGQELQFAPDSDGIDVAASAPDVPPDVAADGGDAAFQSAPHGPPPTVLAFGGSVLTAPKVVPVFFAGAAMQADMIAFFDQLGSSTYWGEVTAEYGVGPLSTGPALILDGPAPAELTDEKLLDMLKKGFAGGKPGWAPVDAQAIYTFIIPQDTAFTDSDESGGACCLAMDGYHFDVQIGATLAAYAVICTCPDEVGPGFSLADQVASTAAHELIEAATDPHPYAESSGYGATDDDHLAWSTVLGGELTDLCAADADFLWQAADISYLVPRSWSNAAAAAGQDPCLPVPSGEPYFNSVPVLKDSIVIKDAYGESWPTLGVQIAKGKSKTIAVQLFSAAPTSGPWHVTARDMSEYAGGKPMLSFTWSATEGTNGDTLQLTIQVLSADATVGAEMFAIESTLGEHASMWFGAVGQ